MFVTLSDRLGRLCMRVRSLEAMGRAHSPNASVCRDKIDSELMSRFPLGHTITLKLFVYGTLKSGCRNHQDFCQGYVELLEATVRGRLYEGPGYPILQVPEADILAHGTNDPLADAATQARLSDRVRTGLQQIPESGAGNTWGTIYGELFTFDDPQTRLPSIDRLEGFHPGGRSLYQRVLVPATVEGARHFAWVYAVENLGISRHRIPSGRWPE